MTERKNGAPNASGTVASSARDANDDDGRSATPLEPVYRKREWKQRLIWLVPLAAAIIAGFYVRAYLADRGPVITLRLSEADGIKPRDTALIYRGVPIGQVSGVDLSPDRRKALVEIRLKRGQEAFAQEGASFWIVRPEISGTGFKGIGALFTGPYIEGTPGEGKVEREFAAMQSPPDTFGQGLSFIVHAPRFEHLRDHSPVYYRGIEVGVVEQIRLGREGDRVEAKVLVWTRYRGLVRVHSRFWGQSGLDVKGGIFSGLDLKLGTLKSMISGAIAFATPEKDMGEPAHEGADFLLENDSQKDWLNWAPKIPIPGAVSHAEEAEAADSGTRELRK
jgi:paraquat-inducible protein B